MVSQFFTESIYAKEKTKRDKGGKQPQKRGSLNLNLCILNYIKHRYMESNCHHGPVLGNSKGLWMGNRARISTGTNRPHYVLQGLIWWEDDYFNSLHGWCYPHTRCSARNRKVETFTCIWIWDIVKKQDNCAILSIN